jgi:hypothetical protein
VNGAVETYHELLADRELAEESRAALVDGQKERGLWFGEHALSVSLRPRLITKEYWQSTERAAESVFSALSTLEKALLASPELRDEIGVSGEEERLALADPGCRFSSPSARLDSFVDAQLGAPRYIEYNAESPAGMAFGDVLGEVVDQMPVMQRFRDGWRCTPVPSRAAQLDCMLTAFADWGRAEKPSVAIVDWKGLPTVAEFEIFRDFFQENGISCCICDPAELSYDGKTLRACDGSVVNLVYRRVLTSELLAKPDAAAPLCSAFLDGAVLVVNTFRAKLLHKKMSLALLSDDAYASLYDSEELDAIERFVPWTRRMREGAGSRGDVEIPDLAEYVSDHRSELVLKPNDEYGGKGVVVGASVDQGEWDDVVQAALDEPYVVQAAVSVPREPYPVVTRSRRGSEEGTGEIEFVDLAIDTNPYLFSGKVSGLLTRLSSSALLNVTAGAGSVVPTYLVERR